MFKSCSGKHVFFEALNAPKLNDQISAHILLFFQCRNETRHNSLYNPYVQYVIETWNLYTHLIAFDLNFWNNSQKFYFKLIQIIYLYWFIIVNVFV